VAEDAEEQTELRSQHQQRRKQPARRPGCGLNGEAEQEKLLEALRRAGNGASCRLPYNPPPPSSPGKEGSQFYRKSERITELSEPIILVRTAAASASSRRPRADRKVARLLR